MMVVVLGPDGCGKSSVIAALMGAPPDPFKAATCFHLRPGLLATGRKEARGTVDDPHRESVRGPLASAAKLIFFVADYVLGYWVRVRPASGDNRLVIFDRYYHDMIVDPYRYRYGGPRWLVRLAGRLIPKPDLWIVLDAPAEVLRARKQEVPFEETARQRTAYTDLAARLENAVVVDAAQPLDRVVADATRAIVNHLAE